jgi:excisionase family DNA binding protein
MTNDQLATTARRAMSVPEWAKFAGIGKSTAWMLVKEGALRAVRIGGRTLILTEDSEAFMKSLPPVRPDP